MMWYNLLMAYSIDFRKKVLAYCERTGSITEASHIFQISRNTIYGWLKLKEKTFEFTVDPTTIPEYKYGYQEFEYLQNNGYHLVELNERFKMVK